MAKPRTYRQGPSIYVVGTDDVTEACRAAGIAPESHRWSSTEFGWLARRQGYWRFVGESEHRSAPKDARRGVCFVGPVREATDDRG